MVSTALLVIDVQRSFEHAPYWLDDELTDLWRGRQSQLIGQARQQGWLVVHVYHNEVGGPFDPANGQVTPMAFVDRQPRDPVFHKRVHNAMTDSGLHEWLQNEGIQRLLISGIRTEQCCETTTRVASDLGYEVDYVLDATLTFPMTHPTTRELVSREQIFSHTALVLADRFARITSVADHEGHAPA